MASQERIKAVDGAKCRTEVLEYGHIPVCPWLGHLNSLVSLQSFLREILRRGQYTDDQSRCFVTLEAIMDSLGATLQQTQVLLDLLTAVLDDPGAVKSTPTGAPAAVDAHRLALFLFVQFYTRDAARMETADVWPPDHPSATQLEPSSPMRLTARAFGKEAAHVRAHLPATRQKMQEYLLYQESLITGFSAFIAKHAGDLLDLVSAGGSVGGGSGRYDSEDIFDASESEMGDIHGEPTLKPAEIDRLGFLLGVVPQQQQQQGGGGGSVEEERMGDEEGTGVDSSPMDLCGTSPAPSSFVSPFLNAGRGGGAGSGGGSGGVTVPGGPLAPPPRFSRLLPQHLWSSDDKSSASVSDLKNWIRTSLGPGEESAKIGQAVGSVGGTVDVSTMMTMSPPRVSMFDQLAPPVLTLLTPVDVHSVHRASALRGESDLAESSSVRVVDCHDAIVYCLAPLQYATVSCCTDCVVVLGAVGQAVRLERCERVQLIVAAQRVVVNTCHDCILYLAVNRPPVLLGDNRFLQLAPHNAGYDRLGEHVLKAGLRARPNAWSAATPLLPDQNLHSAATKHHNAFLAGGGSYGTSPPLNNQHYLPASPSAAAASGLGAGAPTLSPLKVPSPRSSPALMLGGGSSSSSAGGGSVAVAAGAEGAAPAPGQPPSATLLPPEKLVPFLVPFTGGPGPLCGGPAKQRTPVAASFGGIAGGNDLSGGEEDPLGGMLGGAGGSGADAFGPSPFSLPPEFSDAWEERLNGMAAVRIAYRQAGLDDSHKREFIGAVQAHFKEWLQAGSGMRMREVYDLAKAEKEGGATM